LTRYTSIGIPHELKNKLDELRRQLGAEDWAEFFEKIIKIYEEWYKQTVEREVKQALCNDFKETLASLPAWGRLLASKLRDPDKIAAALKYLKLDASGEYVVDKEQCK
jgi:N-glycosylase/DNA lyase